MHCCIATCSPCCITTSVTSVESATPVISNSMLATAGQFCSGYLCLSSSSLHPLTQASSTSCSFPYLSLYLVPSFLPKRASYMRLDRSTSDCECLIEQSWSLRLGCCHGAHLLQRLYFVFLLSFSTLQTSTAFPGKAAYQADHPCPEAPCLEAGIAYLQAVSQQVGLLEAGNQGEGFVEEAAYLGAYLCTESASGVEPL